MRRAKVVEVNEAEGRILEQITRETAQEGWVAASLNASPEDAYLDALLGE